MKKFEVIYTKTVKEVIEAKNLDEACRIAEKKARLKKLLVYGVVPIE